jgi:D-alanyl-D-alanine dipeptidase
MIRLIFLVASTFICITASAQHNATYYDTKMQEYNLVDVTTLEGGENILVELKYTSMDNFVGEDMYGELNRAYLEISFAQRVVQAAQYLERHHPNYRLLIYDAARPISVQRYMRSVVDGTEFESFVADGSKGGRHNYGVAVDLTIATTDGTPLDMGAPFDDFSDIAAVKGTPDNSDPTTRTLAIYRAYAEEQVRKGVLTKEAANNRLLLIEVMASADLVPYRREWWHFEELMPMSETRTKYRLLDF